MLTWRQNLIDKDSRVFVAGHNGLVGSALVRKLRADGYQNIVVRSSRNLDLTKQADVNSFFAEEKPDCVFMAAAYVGGVYSNVSHHTEFLCRNSQMELNVINGALVNGATDLIFIGSACIYPMDMLNVDESTLLTGYPDSSHFGYSVAKILGVEYCRLIKEEYGLNYMGVIPCNLYGPNDNFNLEKCHVVPGLIRRMHEAKVAGAKCVDVKGSSATIREFLYADDLADACMLLLEEAPRESVFNVGTGVGTSISELASAIKTVTGFEGSILFDLPPEDAAPPRLLDNSRIESLGFSPQYDLSSGIMLTYEYFLNAAREGTLREA